ncbi:hypothetical protein BSU04_20435 [Caballeronia sordidicola]|uniref:Uncharacterized protein n=1 Tax=Caballeronia sordidicola TaxID=196367 RepID=A0A226X125_CABSO|nr:hypothetical protein BSU04_20435 [Caballeronia sordidicola]
MIYRATRLFRSKPQTLGMSPLFKIVCRIRSKWKLKIGFDTCKKRYA